MPTRKGNATEKTKSGNARKLAGDKTREKIMASAEILFADHGYEGTSLRGIMAHADVSISLINYHFGTKEGLLRAIFENKTGPLSKQRHDWIQAAAAVKSSSQLDEMLRGYFLPSFRNSLRHQRTNHFMRLVGRIGSDRSEIAREMMREFFDGFQRDFIETLKPILPHLNEKDLYWRLHCLLCILTHTMNNPRRIYELSNGACDFTKVDEAFEHLLPFLVEGLRAPAPKASAKAAKGSRTSLPSSAGVQSNSRQKPTQRLGAR
jgi:AcrR family transcriptional regulator